MSIQPTLTRQKLSLFIDHAPMGLAEIDNSGAILHLNQIGTELLEPVRKSAQINGHNLFPLLSHMAPALLEKIRNAGHEAGNIVSNELHRFVHISEGKKTEHYYRFMAIRLSADSTIVGFDDITDKHIKEKLLEEAVLDKAVVIGKYEIASNILHDIGNAIVGFSSYTNRIKQSLELDNSANLQQLAGFFEVQQPAIAGALGEAKADAVLKVLNGIVHTQKTNQTDIGQSILEQEKIINHIREILNIQRQYISGNDFNERKPLHLESIVNDCISMLFASFKKRDITVSQDVPERLPVVEGDHTRLMQVIMNLLKNSIEAIDVFAVEKSISIRMVKENDAVLVQIKDSGKGFDLITGQKLFSRGFTTKSSGSGLGLNSCRAIIEGHNGTIDISSDGPGKGAITTIKFKI